MDKNIEDCVVSNFVKTLQPNTVMYGLLSQHISVLSLKSRKYCTRPLPTISPCSVIQGDTYQPICDDYDTIIYTITPVAGGDGHGAFSAVLLDGSIIVTWTEGRSAVRTRTYMWII